MQSNCHCLFGGHYGSEGKGSLAESFANYTKAASRRLAVLGENSPNSGHTCSKGKTRNLPASAFFADVIIMGPDSVIDPCALTEDIDAIRETIGACPPIYIHRHAALCLPSHRDDEADVVKRVSSTGSGSGAARRDKQFSRSTSYIVGPEGEPDSQRERFGGPVSLLNHSQYFNLIDSITTQGHDLLFECSQGTLLDINFGTYPYCTSRTTLARVAIERNGLGHLPWKYAGVYRTFPIRTGGPSGPTGGKETSFADLGVPDEIATVTKRIRRVFEFDWDDFARSVRLNRPDVVAFTHLDYLGIDPWEPVKFVGWLEHQSIGALEWLDSVGVESLALSRSIGKFNLHSVRALLS